MRRLRRALLGGFAVWLALRAWAALRPTAYPYFARWILDLPRPLITRAGLVGILAPRPGERILELGPGTGYYTLPVSARLQPGGILEIFDVRQSFLEHTMERARERGFANIVPTLGDGVSSLPRRLFRRGLPGHGAGRDTGAADNSGRATPRVEANRPARRRRDLHRSRLPQAWMAGQARSRRRTLLERRTGNPLGYFARFRPQGALRGRLEIAGCALPKRSEGGPGWRGVVRSPIRALRVAALIDLLDWKSGLLPGDEATRMRRRHRWRPWASRFHGRGSA